MNRSSGRRAVKSYGWGRRSFGRWRKSSHGRLGLQFEPSPPMCGKSALGGDWAAGGPRVSGWCRRMSGRIAAAAVVGMMVVPVSLPLLVAQPEAAQAAPSCNGSGNGNGNGSGNPHCTTTTQGNTTTTAQNTTTTAQVTTTTQGATTTTTCSYPFNNCATSTTAAGPQPIIIISVTVAVPGQTITVTVCGYAPGAVVRITLNGNTDLQIVVPNGNPATCTNTTRSEERRVGKECR